MLAAALEDLLMSLSQTLSVCLFVCLNAKVVWCVITFVPQFVCCRCVMPANPSIHSDVCFCILLQVADRAEQNVDITLASALELFPCEEAGGGDGLSRSVEEGPLLAAALRSQSSSSSSKRVERGGAGRPTGEGEAAKQQQEQLEEEEGQQQQSPQQQVQVKEEQQQQQQQLAEGEATQQEEQQPQSPHQQQQQQPLFNVQASELWVLKACQTSGGLRDKPGKPADYYHTCYCLSGLAAAQYLPGGCVLGGVGNMLERTDPLINVVVDKLEAARQYFKTR
jgi:flagellar motor protein MotB